MPQVTLVSYFFTMIIGLVTLSIVATLTLKSKKEHLIVYLLLYFFLTSDYAIETVYRYLMVNNSEILSSIQPELYSIMAISRYLVLFSFFLIYTHATTGESIKRNSVDLLKFILVCITLNIVFKLYDLPFLTMDPGKIIYYLGIFILLILSTYKILTVKDIDKMDKTTYLEYRFLKKSLMVFVITIPLIVNDDYSFIKIPFRLAPITFIVYSFFIYRHFYSYHLCSSSFGNSKVEIEKFFNRYEISTRERDTLNLVLNGLSNKEISDELNISIHTVKAHIYSAFKKAGIKTRVELINRLK